MLVVHVVDQILFAEDRKGAFFVEAQSLGAFSDSEGGTEAASFRVRVVARDQDFLLCVVESCAEYECLSLPRKRETRLKRKRRSSCFALLDDQSEKK